MQTKKKFVAEVNAPNELQSSPTKTLLELHLHLSVDFMYLWYIWGGLGCWRHPRQTPLEFFW